MGNYIVDRMLLVFRRFNAEDKVDLARQLVEVLELEPRESLIQKAKAALSRDPTEDELFKLDILEGIVRDNGWFVDDDFPEDIGAPKGGR